MAIEIRIRGLRATRRTLMRVQQLARDRVKAHRKTIEAIVFESYTRQFQSRGAEFGQSWAQLKPSTIERKRGFPDPSQPLVRSGRLRASLTGAGTRGRRVTQRQQSIKVINTLDTKKGGGLINALAGGGRRVVGPDETGGIGRRGVRELERLWDRIADEIIEGLEG